MSLGKRQGNLTKYSGQSTVEVVYALVVIIPLLVLLVDCYFIVLGYWLCNSNCRLAARAAAQGPPAAIVKGAPQQRAMAVLNTGFAQAGNTIQVVSLDVSESIKSLPDKIGGGTVNGAVTADLTVDVVPPFLLKSFLPEHKFTINASNSCPYTWTTPVSGLTPVPTDNK